MSSDSVEKKYHILPSYNLPEEDSIDFNKIVIPFSNFVGSKAPLYIYNGIEKIPFRERHPIYQALLKNEFNDD